MTTYNRCKVIFVIAAIVSLHLFGCERDGGLQVETADEYQKRSRDPSYSSEERRRYRAQAIETYSKALDTGIADREKRTKALIQRAALYLREGQCEQAIKDLTRAIDEGSNGTAYVLRGQCFERLSRRQDALADYSKAIERGTEGVVYEYRGEILMHLRRFESAIEDFGEAMKYSPGSWMIRERRGDAYASLGMPEKAIEEYKSALQMYEDARMEVLGRRLRKGEGSPDEDRLREKLRTLRR